MALNTTEELIDDIRQGKMVILMDDEDRENEGDLVMAASQVRPEDINFMATEGRGLVCMPMSRERCQQLNLPLMVGNAGGRFGTNFTLSIEAAEGVTTGISAADRARTVQAAVAPSASSVDIVQPGHIFPIMAQPGGVLSRAGHTEASCDLARLAGYESAAVIVEIMNEDGTMARRPDLEVFAKKHNLKIGTIADLIHHRIATEKTVECIASRSVDTDYGGFQLHTFLDVARGEKHFAFVMGELAGEPPLVRVHVGSALKDVFTLRKPNSPHSSWTFPKAMQTVASEGRGVVVLLCHEETADDIESQLQHVFDEAPANTTKAPMVYQQVGTGSQILRELGVSQMRLLSAPFKFPALSGFDLEVVEMIDCP
ncbi:3,4-dihydroxy-2-butanone-4-phosphate synthase [bacterium SCSIO 12696]|nr:3,4-dihydroxy-2-butanone-4-phosphate synthase [bacterium SCSIO 12696]